MTVYGRLQLTVEQGAVSDYSDARLIAAIVEMAHDEEDSFLVDVSDSTYTKDLAAYTTIEYVVVLNYSTSLTVDAGFTSASTVSKCRLPAADAATKPSMAIIPNVDPAADLTLLASATGPARVRVIIFGS